MREGFRISRDQWAAAWSAGGDLQPPWPLTGRERSSIHPLFRSILSDTAHEHSVLLKDPQFRGKPIEKSANLSQLKGKLIN